MPSPAHSTDGSTGEHHTSSSASLHSGNQASPLRYSPKISLRMEQESEREMRGHLSSENLRTAPFFHPQSSPSSYLTHRGNQRKPIDPARLRSANTQGGMHGTADQWDLAPIRIDPSALEKDEMTIDSCNFLRPPSPVYNKLVHGKHYIIYNIIY